MQDISTEGNCQTIQLMHIKEQKEERLATVPEILG